MSVEYVERHEGSEIYKYVCDEVGCSRQQEFTPNTMNKVRNWKVAILKSGGVVKDQHYICPKCQEPS